MTLPDSFSRSDFKEFWSSAEDKKEYTLLVTGSSMYPFLINEKSIVYIRKPASRSFKRGQILLFARHDGSYVLHRVLKVLPDGTLVMNGDSQSWTERIPNIAVVAVVTKFVRKKHAVRVNSSGYRALTAIWMALLPIRTWIFKCGHCVKSAVKRVR